MGKDLKHALWVEKYRPATIRECVLPESKLKFFEEMRDTGEIQNMLLSGTHGVGKTTIAKALCNEMGADYMFLNCSKERGIDDVRVKINTFASSMSLSATSRLKVIICDESDHLTNEAQMALRGVIEAVSKNCRFIFTCNFPNKIADPLKSRLLMQNFSLNAKDRPIMAKTFMGKCAKILESEGVEYENKVLAMIIKANFPDFRKVMQILQHASLLGKLDAAFLEQSGGEFAKYIQCLKKKDYKAARKWIGENPVDGSEFFNTLFNGVNEIFAEKSRAEAILILQQCQFEHALALDQDLSLGATTVKLMSSCEFMK